MAYNLKERMPDFADQISRIAYRVGYNDGYYGRPRDNGSYPVQPYSKGYWEGVADR